MSSSSTISNLEDLQPFLQKIHLPTQDSHKGQNGKVMLIGGSELFHAASQWSLLVVSRMVDMVFYSSVPSNNDLITEAKEQFHNGIVVPRNEVENYVDEAEVILIGPGMERSDETEEVTNELLVKFSHKKWVVDAGALQMGNPSLFTEKTIVTPHQKEFGWLMERTSTFTGTCLLKGKVDEIFSGSDTQNHDESLKVEGGNEGMTKGGTGDVLAGLVAGLYSFTDDPVAAATVGSFVNKKAGDELYKTVGPFFNATDLANQIPKTLREVFPQS